MPRISSGGRSPYRIVLGEDASPSEVYAGEELRKFIEEIGGCELPVVKELREGERGIFLGDGPALRRLVGDGIDYGRLGEEGFVLRTVGPHIVISGGRRRGTLYGVYTFLEKYLGCRWYTPDVSKVPKVEAIDLPELDEEYLPSFEYREVFYAHAFDGDWAARNKVNGSHMELEERHGGKVKYSHFVHTFYQLVPPGRYFEEHPEYFSLVGGRRTAERAQLCLTNPDVLRIAAGEVFRWIEEDPEASIFSVSQNDWGGWCECEICSEVDEREGARSGTIISFVNEIAEKVAGMYTDKFIDTLAYQYSEDVPKHVRPHPQVIVRLCHMAPCCDSHPITSCELNARYRRNLEGWTRISERVYIWHYVVNFAHYLMPFPNFNAIREDIPYYKEKGVKGIFCQGDYALGGGGEMAELRAYILARLLWDVEVDVDEVMDDFLRGYYGRASGPIREYIDMLHSKVRDPEAHMNLYSSPYEVSYLTSEVLRKASDLFDEAERLADDDQVAFRVEAARIPIEYARLALTSGYRVEDRKLVPGPDADEGQLRRFAEMLKGHGIVQVSEGRSLEEFLP
ncbi:MAG TPA: DUF4838 domain-containing protein [Candidatus Latescibacteria bacterium]|nr:DUF4838 domain-containing protein [Candidatus Latescibacterota bacterium]